MGSSRKKTKYRVVTLVVAYLGWIDLDFDVRILLRQNWMCRWAR